MTENFGRRPFLRLLSGFFGAGLASWAGLSVSERPGFFTRALQKNTPGLVIYPYHEKLRPFSSTLQRVSLNSETIVWNILDENQRQWFYGRHPSPLTGEKNPPLPTFEIGTNKKRIILSRDSMPKHTPNIPDEFFFADTTVLEYYASPEIQIELDKAFNNFRDKDEDAGQEISMTAGESTWFTISRSVETVVSIATDPLGELIAEWRKTGDKTIPLISKMNDRTKWSSGLFLASIFAGTLATADSAQATARKRPETRGGFSRRLFLAGITAAFLGGGRIIRSQAQQAGSEAASGFNLESFLALKPINPDSPNDQLDVFWSKFSADFGEPPLYAAVLLRDLISVYMEKALTKQGLVIDTNVWGLEHEQQVGLRLLAEEELLTMIELLFTKYGTFFRNYLSINDFATSTSYYYKRNESGNLIMHEIKFHAFRVK